MTDTTSRLDELEMRTAHQEQTIEDLNTAITEQWKIIERMERQLAALRDRVADAELSGPRPCSRHSAPCQHRRSPVEQGSWYR